MSNFLSKNKFIFYLANIFLIVLYLFPGSILGFLIYDDMKIQPQITSDFLVSTNHLYAFFLISLIGILTFNNSKKLNLLILYFLLLSIILEIFHLIIPERSFQLPDLFGNLIGVFLMIIINFFFKRYENSKK
jgi:VanZ family protein